MRFVTLALATCVLTATLHGAASAACTAEDMMTKVSDISEVLMPKMQSKPEEAAKIMSEMGTATGTGAATPQACAALDALMLRAKRL